VKGIRIIKCIPCTAVMRFPVLPAMSVGPLIIVTQCFGG
jgi:hypothetical protein